MRDSTQGQDRLGLSLCARGVSPERRADLNRYAGLRYKALIAREHGAKALLVVTGPNSPGAGELVSIASNAGMTDSAIPAASISLKTAEALFAAGGRTSRRSNPSWTRKLMGEQLRPSRRDCQADYRR